MPLLGSGGTVFHVFLEVTNMVLYVMFNCRVRPEGKPPSPQGPAALLQGVGPRVGASAVRGDPWGPPDVPARSCLGAWEGFQESFLLDRTQKTRGKAARAPCCESLLWERESWMRRNALLLPTAGLLLTPRGP